MQTFKRLFFSTDKVIISDDENKLFSDQVSDYSKKFIIQRKTTLKLVIILLSFTTIFELVNLILSSQIANNTILSNWTINNFMAIDISLFIISCIKIVLFSCSLYYWNNYKKSIVFTHIAGLIFVYLQLSYLFIPYCKLISFNFDNIDVSEGIWNSIKNNYFFILSIITSLISYFLPITLILQSTIGRLLTLNSQFNSPKLKIASNILTATYIPLISFVFFIGYQASVFYNHILPNIPNFPILPSFSSISIIGIPLPTFIILLYISYIFQLISALFTQFHPLIYICNLIGNIISIVMMISMMVHFGINISIGPMFIRYFVMSIFISDFIMGQVIFNKKDDKDLDKFISDINIGKVNDYNNMIEDVEMV